MRWRRAACRAIRYAGYVALALAVASAALLLMNRLGLAFPVEGVSMLPVLRTGDLALTLPSSVSAVQPGDVIVYRSPAGFLVIHRVLEKGNGYLIVKGDDNPVPDPWRVTNSMIVGRVYLVIDYLGYMALPPFTYSVAAVLVALYALYAACERQGLNRV